VFYYRLHNGYNVFIGGASLVSPNKIVTLASAVKDYKDSEATCEEDIRPKYEMFVVCGSVNLRIPDEPGQQTRPVTGVLIHPEFNQKSLINDVAVLIVEKNFQFTESVGAVCLPEPGKMLQVNTTCIATGHGKDGEGDLGYFSNELRKVNLPIWSSVDCENTLNKNYFQQNHSITWRMHESFLCAGGQEDQDTCEGDGGGPLVCYSSDPVRIDPVSDPVFGGGDPVFGGGDPVFADSDPVFGGGDPVFADSDPVFTDEANVNNDFDLDLRGNIDLRSSESEDSSHLTQYGVTAWGIGCALYDIPSVYSSLASPAIRCWLDQVLSCYGEPEETVDNPADFNFDLRTDELKSKAGFTETQCGAWLDSDSALNAACGCFQILSDNPVIEDNDFDLRESDFDLRTAEY